MSVPTVIHSGLAAPEGNLSGLLVTEYRTRLGVYYAEVAHRGVVLLNCRTTAVAQALTRLQAVDWVSMQPGDSEAMLAGVAAIRHACELEGVSCG